MDSEQLGEEAFDRYARMVRRALGVPVATVTLIESTRQVFLGAAGMSEELMARRQTPLTASFCQYVVADSAPLVVADARLDPRLRDNLAITDAEVIAYAGWPLVDAHGATIGSLCAIDHQPRDWSEADLEALTDLAAVCSAELIERTELVAATHRAVAADDRAVAADDRAVAADDRAVAARRASEQSRVLLSLSEGLAHTRTLGDVAQAVERAARDALDCLRAGIWLRQMTDPGVLPPVLAPPARLAEQLTYVADGSRDWAAAEEHVSLSVAADNPLGAVVLSGRAAFFRDRDEQNALYPHLVSDAQIGQARAFVPLLAGDRVYGAMALLWPERRDFGRDDRRAITAMAAYTSQAVHRALLLQERVDVATALQHAMLTELPQPGHLLLEARYRPAGPREQVGGDWYDAFVLPDGDTSIMVGDVMGHDISAAGVMGQLRNMLRAFAWGNPDLPSRTVKRLEQACSRLAPEAMATLLYGRIESRPEGSDAAAHTLHWTNAGHLPLLLATADGVVSDPGEGQPTDALLGMDASLARHDHSVVLPPGSTLLLYTDGLVERRGENLEVSIERLRAEVGRLVHLPLPDLLDQLLDTLVGDHPGDDVVVLAVRIPD